MSITPRSTEPWKLAWQNAEHLWHLRSTPALANGFLEMRDGFTTVIGKALMVPVL